VAVANSVVVYRFGVLSVRDANVGYRTLDFGSLRECCAFPVC